VELGPASKRVLAPWPPEIDVRIVDDVLSTFRTRHDPASSTRPASGLARLAALAIAHRRAVGLFWLAVAALGVALVGPIAGRLTSGTELPGLPSYRAGEAIAKTYGSGGNNTVVVALATLAPGHTVDSPAGAAEAEAAFAPIYSQHRLRVMAYPTVPDARLVSANGRTALGVIFEGARGPTAKQIAAQMAAAAPEGVTVSATSLEDLYAGSGGGIGVLGEVIIGSVGALAIMIIIFGSLLALIPLLVALVSILATFLAIGAITTATPVSQLVEFLVSLIGLGIAIDYSLLIVTRWREEATRRPNNEAVIVAVATAGRAVALSGVTVAVGLFCLILLPIPFLRSLGYGGLLIPAVTVVAALTLLPALLSAWGPRLDRRRSGIRPLGRRPQSSRGWSAWTRTVIRHRVWALGVGLLVIGLLLALASQLRVGEVNPTSLARNGPAETGLHALQDGGFPLGALQPIEVLVPDQTDPAILASRLGAVAGVDAALAPTGPDWRRHGTALVEVIPAGPTSSKSADATVGAVERLTAHLAPGAQVAGDGPVEADLVHAYYSRFPLIIAVVALIIFVALARAFRAPIIALKALVLNFLSVGAAYGMLVLMWQDGHGSQALWGIPPTGVVIDFVPLMLFAFLFGLSMDYEVFILSRIKEAHDNGATTDEAIVEGLGQTGRLVTSAALILFLAFAALAAGPEVPVKIFASGMAVGILLDATIIRALLVPAVISLLGDRIWWTPGARGGRTVIGGATLAPQPAEARRASAGSPEAR
jgi:RND superfamily putative drug exporter